MNTLTVTVAHDGTLTRSGARMMREALGCTDCVPTGSTTLAQARRIARLHRTGETSFEFVQATRPDVPAKVSRKAAPKVESTGFVRAQIREASARKAALEALTALAS